MYFLFNIYVKLYKQIFKTCITYKNVIYLILTTHRRGWDKTLTRVERKISNGNLNSQEERIEPERIKALKT